MSLSRFSYLIQITRSDSFHLVMKRERRKRREKITKESSKVWKGLYKKKDAFLVHLFVVWWKRTPPPLSHHKAAGDNSIALMRENLPPLERLQMKRNKKKVSWLELQLMMTKLTGLSMSLIKVPSNEEGRKGVWKKNYWETERETSKCISKCLSILMMEQSVTIRCESMMDESERM